MSETTYLAESGVLSGLNPDILVSDNIQLFEGSAPCVCRRKLAPIGDGTDFNNMIFKGKFKTNDTRNDPSNIFLTVLRNGPQDPDSDIEHFNNGYGIALMPLNAQSAADGRYNVFVVDNSIAVPRVVLENVVHTGWGDMPYLKTVSTTLDPDTWYNFEIQFGTNGTFEFFLAATGTFFGAATISQGAYQPQSSGTYYGVAISYNQGKVWSIDDLSLFYKTAQHAINEYLLDSAPFSDQFTVKAYGNANGDDGNPTPAYGITMYGYNYTNSLWMILASHNNGPGDGSFLLDSGAIPKVGYASPSDGFIRIILASAYPSNYGSGIESYLNIDEVFAENWDTASSHVGGMGDIYIKETSVPTEYSFDMYNVGASEWIRESNVKITEDLFLPLLFLVKVESIDAMGIVTALLVEGINYSISVDDPYRTFSSDEQRRIIFIGGGGFNVRVTYKTFDTIKSIQTYVDANARSNYADDLLAFLCSPVEIFMELDYRGSESRGAIRTETVNWIMGEVEDSIDTYAIEAKILAMENVSNLDVTALRFKVYDKEGSFTMVPADSMTLTKPDFQQFFIFNDATHISFTTESD